MVDESQKISSGGLAGIGKNIGMLGTDDSVTEAKIFEI